MITLQTPDAIVKVLGGTGAVAALTNKSPASISNAKRRGWFPRDSYAVMHPALRDLGYTASAHLWKQVGTPSEKRRA